MAPFIQRAGIWVLDVLPEISNMALAVVGVLMSFPVKAEAVEKNPFWRRVTAWTCIVLGVSGLVVSAHQRHESESRLETVAANTKTAVDELSPHFSQVLRDRLRGAVNDHCELPMS